MQRPSALAMIAGRAGCHEIRPGVFATQMLGLDVIHRQVDGILSTVLAGILIAAEDLTAAKTYLGVGSLHHVMKSDH